MNVLVTGGAGMIGKALVKALVKEGHSVSVIDIHDPEVEGVKFYEGTIMSSRLLNRAFNDDYEVVFHLAALTSVLDSFDGSLSYFRVNVGGSIKLINQCLEYGVKRFIFSSSCAMLEDKPGLLNEGDIKLTSPYAMTKYTVEDYLCLVDRFGFPFSSVSLRYANVYGLEGGGVIPIFLRRALKGMDLLVNGDGGQVRDFIHVSDVVTANLLAMNDEVEGTYNIGTGVVTTINHLAKMIKRLTKSKSKIINCKPWDGDVKNSCLDIKKAQRYLGYYPKVNLLEGLEMMMDENNYSL